MSNTDAPCGLSPHSPNGTTPQITKYKANTTTDIFRGDVVAMASNGNVHTITTTTGSAYVCGVAANYVDASASSSAQDIWVYDDPDQHFIVQDDGDSSTPAYANVGSTFVAIVNTGNTTTGQSKHEIDASSTGTATNDLFLVRGFLQGPKHEVGKYAKTIVTLNRHLFKKNSAGI